MTETKYIVSNGIAFMEEKDLRELRNYAADGWIVKRFKHMGYELEKGSAEDVIFTIDVRKLDDAEFDEYVEMFAIAGWVYISSNADLHLFKAMPGTKPIYTDKDSQLEKIKQMRRSVLPITSISGALLLISYVVRELTSGLTSTIALGGFFISLIVFVPMLMTLLATVYKTYRIQFQAEC